MRACGNRMWLSLMEPHTPIRLTVDFSHIQCQVGWKKVWGKSEKRKVQGKVSGRGWREEASRYRGATLCVCAFLSACVNSTSVYIYFELIPIKTLQRAALCQSLTPPLICWHRLSEMRKPTNGILKAEQRRRHKAAKIYNTRLRGSLSGVFLDEATTPEVKTLAKPQRITNKHLHWVGRKQDYGMK